MSTAAHDPSYTPSFYDNFPFALISAKRHATNLPREHKKKKENKCNILLFPSFVYMSSSLGLRQVLIWAMALKIGGSAARRILPEIIIISLKKKEHNTLHG